MKPRVTLLSHTKDPLKVLNCIFEISRFDHTDPSEILEGDLTTDRRDFFRKIIESKIPVAEMVDFVFLLSNVSIAFREQMVRHRVGTKCGDRIGVDIVPNLVDSSWWSQSMRILNMGEFCKNEQYEIPEAIEQHEERALLYRLAMQSAELAYQQLIEQGVPAQEARMVLPLATQHSVVWKINLNSMINVVGKRSCWLLQLGFWGPVIKGMINELSTKVDPLFRLLASPPCMRGDDYIGCIGGYENKEHLEDFERDPNPTCPLWYSYEKLNGHFDNEVTDKAIKDAFPLKVRESTIEIYEKQKQDYQALWGRDVYTGKIL